MVHKVNVPLGKLYRCRLLFLLAWQCLQRSHSKRHVCFFFTALGDATGSTCRASFTSAGPWQHVSKESLFFLSKNENTHCKNIEHIPICSHHAVMPDDVFQHPKHWHIRTTCKLLGPLQRKIQAAFCSRTNSRHPDRHVQVFFGEKTQKM